VRAPYVQEVDTESAQDHARDAEDVWPLADQRARLGRMRSLTFHKAVTSEIWDSLSASDEASVERVWHTPNAAHQRRNRA